MADVLLAGIPVLAGDLILPRWGNWTAHLQLQDAPPTGRVTLTWLGTELQGYVLHGGEHEGRCAALVVGGAGGLGGEIAAAGYDATVRVQDLLQRIAADAGEEIAPLTLTASVPAWARMRGTAGAALDELARVSGLVWRVQLDGKIWMGAETWPAATLEGVLQDLDPALPCAALAPDALSVLPGQTLEGRRVGTVVYTVDPGAHRARAWFEDEGAQDDPLRAGLYQIAREALRGVDYLALYPCKVVTQRGDGTLDLEPESPRVPPLTSVRPRVPCHGAKLTVPAGARLLLGFDGGDPSRPYAALWEQGSGGKAVARVGDKSKIGAPLSAWMSQVEVALNALAPGSVTTLSNTFLAAPGVEIYEGSPHLALLPGSTP